MDNPATMATFGTQCTKQRQTIKYTTQKIKMISNADPNKTVVNSSAGEG